MEEKTLTEEELNLRQEEFCKLYTGDEEFFGNGVQSYIKVYKPDQEQKNWYKIACQSASQILSNIKVCRRINELLQEKGLNDEFIDKQLLFLATQHADFSNKLGAIREYNKLKARITEKIDHTSKGEKIYNWSTYGNNTIPSAPLDKTIPREQGEVESNSQSQTERENNSDDQSSDKGCDKE